MTKDNKWLLPLKVTQVSLAIVKSAQNFSSEVLKRCLFHSKIPHQTLGHENSIFFQSRVKYQELVLDFVEMLSRVTPRIAQINSALPVKK